ncbi:MAG: hypothetical protein Q8K78_19505 [Planctomycetaceae bacterium]|nr:hypothetical protein [Planctomycetaceae bacterium]
MPWFDYFWYTENVQHLAEHGVTPEEFEEVVTAARWIETSSSGSDMVRGSTAAGRFLVCVFDQIDDVSVIPITAYEPTKGNS